MQGNLTLGTKGNQKATQAKSQNSSNLSFINDQAFKAATNPIANNFNATNNLHLNNLKKQEASKDTNLFNKTNSNTQKETVSSFSSLFNDLKNAKEKPFNKYFMDNSSSKKGDCFNIIGMFTPGEFLNNTIEKDGKRNGFCLNG